MGKYRPSGNLIIGGQLFPTDAPIVNFREGPKWDSTSELCIPTDTDPNPWAPNSEGYPGCSTGAPQIPYALVGKPNAYTKRYTTRAALRTRQWNGGMNAPYDAIKNVIKQFVVHHDGCSSADMCFSVLQNERGLSCHFLLDNDGTIFQTIDLGLAAYHGGNHNYHSIGVELCNRGDAKKEPAYYASGRRGPQRAAVPCKINGHTILAFEYTKAQMDAFIKLSRALLRLLPNLPAEYPQSSPGVQEWNTMPPSASWNFSGYIGHYHLIPQKWDPGPFDFKKFCSDIRGAFCFPVFPKKDTRKPEDKPFVPERASAIKEASEDMYKQNEAKADGGFFPVGPWGEARLWHGGVHLAGTEGDRVFSPFPGRLVAARMGPAGPIGSTNFALIRHQLSLGTRKVEFYSLYMHLADETKHATPAGWVTSKDGGWASKGKVGEVVLLDEAIEAGAMIGHVGTAGPADLAKAQVHIEIFSHGDLFENWPNSPWEVVDGSTSGRFSESPRVNDIIDSDRDGTMSRQELSSFYTGGGGANTRYLVTLHVSEWTAEPSWLEALRQPKDFKSMKADDLEALVNEQIVPGLWWDQRVATHARLPPDGVVYHYHPVSFVGWFNQQMAEAAVLNAAQPKIDASQAKTTEELKLTDDLGDKDGTHMRSMADEAEDPCNLSLTLKELAAGYDAPECAATAGGAGGTP